MPTNKNRDAKFRWDYDLKSLVPVDSKTWQSTRVRAPNIDHERFDQIRLLLAKTEDIRFTADVMGYSDTTISLVGKAINFDNYKELLDRKHGIPPVAGMQTMQASATVPTAPDMTEARQFMERAITALEGIHVEMRRTRETQERLLAVWTQTAPEQTGEVSAKQA